MNIKPKLTSSQLVEKMKDDQGITFNYHTLDEAERYLIEVNNYLRTASYRKNYKKHTEGINKGKYINLDFAYLKELSKIDMHLRFLIQRMCSDIEHALKVKLVSEIEKSANDGYELVQRFLAKCPRTLEKIEFQSSSPYVSKLIRKYFMLEKSINPETGKHSNKIIDYSKCPIWVLVEVLSFGDFIACYRMFYDESTTDGIPSNLLNLVKSLRNCCAHNNCIIHDLSSDDAIAPRALSLFVSNVPGVSRDKRSKRLRCRPVLEFVAILYVYSKVVSESITNVRMQELKDLLHVRFKQKSDYFTNNELLISNYNFVCLLVNHYF